jgi:hypothetical protein
VSAYLVRYSTATITSESDWSTATPATSGIPTPAAVGFAQSMTISGLTPGTTYYIAVRGQDAGPNLGPIVATVAAAKSSSPIGKGMYDDNDSAWIYSAGWSTYSGSGPYNSTLHYNNANGATASITFIGTQFILSYTAYSNRGSFEVWMDGALETTINAYSATLAWQKTYTSRAYANGTHTVMLKNVGGSTYQDVDVVQVIGPVGPGTYDDKHAAWVYGHGTWYTYAGAGPYNSTLHYNNTNGSTAMLSFTGTQFILYYTAYSNRGLFEVWVDGALETTINAYSAALAWQKTYTSPMYANGTHTVMLKNVGGSTYQDVDAIRIVSPATAGMYDDTYAGWTYVGAWTTYSGTGPYGGTLHYNNAGGTTASFTFNGTQFVLTYTVCSNRGSFEVWMDGAYVVTVNAYSASLLWQKAYVSAVYSPGNHTVVLKNVGPSGIADVDSIRILP